MPLSCMQLAPAERTLCGLQRQRLGNEDAARGAEPAQDKRVATLTACLLLHAVGKWAQCTTSMTAMQVLRCPKP